MHTAGPWKTQSYFVIAESSYGGKEVICTMANGLSNSIKWAAEIASEEDTANARLISAAPALLTALRYIITSENAMGYANPEKYARSRFDEINKLVKEAIARAEG